jgi:hypothetical protein
MKLNIIFHYNVDEQTGEITYIGKEEVTVDTTPTTKSTKSTKTTKTVVNEGIVLDSNKITFSQEMLDLLGAEVGCRIDIRYERKNGVSKPIIGTSDALEVKSGNKLTKSGTISFRGSANERLATYGTNFTLEPTENKGIFYLVGDKEDTTNDVPEELIDIESELEIESLEEIDFTL